MSTSKKAPNTLSDADVDQLERWQPNYWIPLLVHEEVRLQIEHALRTGTSAVIYGQRGVGKTETVQRTIARLQQREVQRAMKDPNYQPKQIERYQTSTAGGAKTAIVDLMEYLTNAHVQNAGRQQSARSFSVAIGRVLQDYNVGLVVIDEAHKIAASNLDHLIAIPDIALEELDHRVGFVFVGNGRIRRSLAKIRQLGQRVVTDLEFTLAKREEIREHLPALHPHLQALHGALGKREWGTVESVLLTSMQGSPRRLVRLIELANGLAIKFRKPIDVQLLRDAASQLADQI